MNAAVKTPAKVPVKVLVVDIGGTGRQDSGDRPEGAAQVPVRHDTDARADGRGGQEAREGLGVRRGLDRLSRARSATVVRPPSRTTWREGWVGFDFEAAFGCPVKVINDAAMQALGSYKGGTMLFLGLGTGLGSALIVDGTVEPMELGHLPYQEEDVRGLVGLRGLEKLGRKKWREARRGGHGTLRRRAPASTMSCSAEATSRS